MTPRPRHPDKELEAIIQDLELRNWRVERGRKYYKAKCPCVKLHMKTIHLTPSGRMYSTNLRKWFERQSCWEG